MKLWKAAVIFGALAVSASSSRADLLTSWNLVTTGDLYATSTAQGAVRVGGNLYVQNNFDVAQKSGSPVGANPSLLVGGNVKTQGTNPETIKVLQGNAVVGGTINGASNNNGRIVSAPKGSVKFDSTVSRIGADDAKELSSVSSAFQSMQDTQGTVYLPSKQVDTAKFTVKSLDSNGNAVFNVDGEKLFENSLVRGFTLDLNGFKLGAGQSVIFNVSGLDIGFLNGLNFDGAFRSATSNILWNFFEATAIDLNRNSFAGAMLAPEAILKNTGNLAGSIFVGSLGSGSSNGLLAGVQTPMYSGYDPSKITPGTTPEPASLAMAGIALIAGLAFDYRRRRLT